MSEAPQEEWRTQANKAIVESVNRGLGVTGETGKQVMLYLIEGTYQVPIETIPEDPEGFVFALRSILHLGSANVLASIIVELENCRPKSELAREFVASFTSALRQGQLSVETGID